MRRKILLREGLRCANPHCGKAAHQCHHIQMRSEGGPTRMWNEIALCSTCHALVHAGLLKVTGRPGQALDWTTAGDTLDRRVEEAEPGSEVLPVIEIPSAYPDAANGSGPSVPPSWTLPPDLLKNLIRQLEHCGFDKKTAKADLLRAAAELLPGECTEKTLLETAFRNRRERNRAGRQPTGDVRVPVPPAGALGIAHPHGGRPESGRAELPSEPG
jgi:hypothetical protein